MIDAATKEPIRVDDVDKDYLSISVSVQHLDQVVELLKRNTVRFWVAHDRVSVNHGPFMARVNLRRGSDAQQVQSILDSTA